MPLQLYNSEAVGLRSAHFPMRNEPNYAWGNILSIFTMQQNLRLLLTMSSVDESGNLYDLSGQGRKFTNKNSVLYGVDRGIVPYSYTTDTTNYLQRISEPGLNITGSMTIMFWHYPTHVTITTKNLLGKYYTVGDKRQYICQITPTSYPQFVISDNGTVDYSVNGNVKKFIQDNWNFYAARFRSAEDICVWVNPSTPTEYTCEDTFIGGVPGTIHSDTEPLEIFRSNRTQASGAYSRFGIVAIYAAALSDVAIWASYQLSRPYYGVR